MPIPNTFLVGAPKCGTSALAQYLGEHPDVFFCDPKEPFFWSDDYPGLADQHGLKSLDDYLRLFARARPAQRIVAEGSTNYLASARAIARIVAFNPDARFIVMLRNPVDVAHAFHMEQVFVLNEDEPDFETAWRLQERRRRGEGIPRNCRAPQFLQYGEVASYAPQVRRLLDLVPRHSVHFIEFDLFRQNPGAAYASSLAFLGLTHDGRTAFPVVNATRRHRSKAIARAVLGPPRLLRRPVEMVRGHLRRQRYAPVEALKEMLRAPGTREPLSAALRRELAACFAPDVSALETLLGWDLRHWRAA